MEKLLAALIASFSGAVASSCAASLMFLIWSMWLGGFAAIPLLFVAFAAALFCTVPIAIVFAVPLYLVISRLLRLNQSIAVVCGLGIGMAVSGGFSYLISVTPPTAVEGYVWTWDQEGVIVLIGGFLGVIGGVSFFRTIRSLLPEDEMVLP